MLGVSTKTLQRWDVAGKIKMIRTPGGRRRVPASEVERLMGEISSQNEKHIAVYARVSSAEQKKKGDLDRQVHILLEKAKAENPTSLVSITDVGSGLNDQRKGIQKLMKIAKDGEITDVFVLYKDRLTRFGFHYLETYFSSHGVSVHVLHEQTEEKTTQQELAEDLLAVVTSFSGKLYGLQSHKNQLLKDKVKGVLEDVANVPNESEE